MPSQLDVDVADIIIAVHPVRPSANSGHAITAFNDASFLARAHALSIEHGSLISSGGIV